MIKTILVAIDASDQRQFVLAQAVEIANHFEADLHLVSVNDPAKHWELTMADPVPEIFASLEAEVSHLLEDAGQQLEKLGIAYRAHMLEGAAIEQIALLAEQISADLIVIGHRHLSRLRRLVDNSVAKGVVARAPCSVMISIEAHKPPLQRNLPTE